MKSIKNHISAALSRVAKTVLPGAVSIALAACSLFGGHRGDDVKWGEWVDSVSNSLNRQDTSLAVAALDNSRAYIHTDRQRFVVSAYDAIMGNGEKGLVEDYIRQFARGGSNPLHDSLTRTPHETRLLVKLYEKSSAMASERGDVDEALRRQTVAADVAHGAGFWTEYFCAQSRLLRMHDRIGNYDTSVSGYLSLLEECHNQGMNDGEIDVLFRLCLVFLRMGDVATAEIYLNEMESVQSDAPADDCKYWLAVSYVSSAGSDSTAFASSMEELLSLKQSYPAIAKYFGLQIDCITASYLLNAGLHDRALNVIRYALIPGAKRGQSLTSWVYLKMLEAKIRVREGNLENAKAILDEITPEALRQSDISLVGLYDDVASEYYSAAGNGKLAYDYTMRRELLIDSLRVESTTNWLAFKTLENRRDTTIVSKVNLINKAGREVERTLWSHYLWLFVSVFCIILAVIVYITYFHSRSIKQKNAELERQRELLAREVKRKRELILEHKWQLESKNKSLQSELSFAKYIQSNILSRETVLSSAGVSEHFVFFRPCYQVSGDFYWFYDKGDKLFVCAADATGHGIPGAFISMVASALLTDIASNTKNLTPAVLLEELSVSLSSVLRNNTDIINADSVDMTVLCVDRERKETTLSMARHVAYIVRADGKCELVQGTKRCVGEVIEVEDGRPFSDIKVDLAEGDCVYLASDGFVSQFGGPENQKFKRKRFENLLCEIHDMPADKQKEILEQRFDDWKGVVDQTDDVLVIGVRLGEL